MGLLGPIRVPAFLNKGVPDIYRGVSAAFLGTIPTGLLYWCAYEGASALLRKVLPEDSPLLHLSSAAAGALTSSVVRVPGDTVRHQVRQQGDDRSGLLLKNAKSRIVKPADIMVTGRAIGIIAG